MPAFDDLPTKDQISAICEAGALEDIRDDVERAISKIETDLEYGDGDDAWAHRARNALAHHRYIERLLHRRIKQLTPKPRAPTVPVSSPRSARKRQASECSAMTIAALNGDRPVSGMVPDDLGALDQALDILTGQIAALKNDRDDEILRFADGERDTDWLARVGIILRKCGVEHQEIMRRAGAIRRKDKLRVQAHRDAERPQLFIDVAREVLDRDTFLAIWATVDRRSPLATSDDTPTL